MLAFTGMEIGNTSEFSSASGTNSVQSTTKRTGTYAFKVNPTTTATSYGVFRTYSASTGASADYSAATAYHTFWFLYVTKPASGDEPICSSLNIGVSVKFELRINSGGNLVAYDSALSLLGTGSTVLVASRWYWIDVKVGTGTSAAWELRINGVTELSGSTANLTTTNNGSFRLGKGVNRNGNSVEFYYDDAGVDDAAYLGPGEVRIMRAVANGTYTAWTGATPKWDQVDEVPPNSTDSLDSTLTVGDAYTAAVATGSASFIHGSVKSVKPCVSILRVGAAPACRLRLRSNTTDHDTTADVGGAFSVLIAGMILNTDPATSATWTLKGLDTLEVGAIERSTVNKTTLVQVCIMVWSAGNAGDFYSPLSAAWPKP